MQTRSAIFATVAALMLGAAGPAQRAQRLDAALGAMTRGDDARAATAFDALADEGSAAAETLLGVIAGRGHAARPEVALAHYYRSAERGYPPAQLALARALARREGTWARPEMALRWALVAQTHSAGDVRPAATALAAELRGRLDPAAVSRAEALAAAWRPWDGFTL
jgi:TPR repeat protein